MLGKSFESIQRYPITYLESFILLVFLTINQNPETQVKSFAVHKFRQDSSNF